MCEEGFKRSTRDIEESMVLSESKILAFRVCGLNKYILFFSVFKAYGFDCEEIDSLCSQEK